MPRYCDFGLKPTDLESGKRVTCDVGYLYANFSLPRPVCSRLGPDVRDRQTSDSIISAQCHKRTRFSSATAAAVLIAGRAVGCRIEVDL